MCSVHIHKLSKRQKTKASRHKLLAIITDANGQVKNKYIIIIKVMKPLIIRHSKDVQHNDDEH